ncbi:MAG: DUF11 domain-containing protein, partial [Thermoplasmata archaeon]|nr:DUF11 domain-containing protein [Thermoplasmata archaeon]
DNATASIGPIYGWLNTTVSDPLMDIIKIAPASASPGEIITYTIDYLNIGTDIAYNVVITEEYPAGVTFISAIPAPDVGNNVWNIGNVPIGGGGTITVTVQIDAMTTGTLDNYANLTYEDSFGQIMPEVPSFAQTIVTWPMMEVQKTGPATATDGETIEYIITYWNNGTDIAHNVTITETYPVNVTFEDANPMPDVPTDNVWTIGDVAAGASGVIYINVTIDVNATGLLVNDITLDYETPGFIVQPPVLAQATTLLSGPYMTISKTTGQLIANTGELIIYTITYDNIGTEDAENVIITETYPLGVTFISALPAPDIGNNIWVIPIVADGTGGVIIITVQVDDWVPAGTVLNNIVEIDYNNTAGVPLPTESDDAQTTIVDPLMTITKTGPATANTGETITYTITYFNSGTEDAYNIWINETYDAGVSFVSAVPMPDVPDFAWDIGTVPMGTGGTILIDVTVDALVGTIWNYIDMNHTDDNDEYQMEIGDSCSTDIINPLIVLDKVAPANAAPGQTIIYFINYFNLGNDWAFNINITETYPADVTFVSAVPVPTFGNDVWIIPALAPGANGVIAITVTVDSLAVGILENFVNATYEGTAGIQPVESQEWENTTVVNCLVDITKEAPATA